MSHFALAKHTADLWMARKLGDPALFAGVTTEAERKRRVRQRIIDLGLADAEAGKRDGQPETWRALFARVFHEPLEANKKTEPTP
mgnify:CR=1 FL=1